jgi:hypothetical protein
MNAAARALCKIVTDKGGRPVAEALGVSLATISGLSGGKRLPSLFLAVRIESEYPHIHPRMWFHS